MAQISWRNWASHQTGKRSIATGPVDSGSLDFERVHVDLSEILTSVAADTEVLAEDRGVSLRVDAGKGIAVMGDPMRLRQPYSSCSTTR